MFRYRDTSEHLFEDPLIDQKERWFSNHFQSLARTHLNKFKTMEPALCELIDKAVPKAIRLGQLPIAINTVKSIQSFDALNEYLRTKGLAAIVCCRGDWNEYRKPTVLTEKGASSSGEESNSEDDGDKPWEKCVKFASKFWTDTLPGVMEVGLFTDMYLIPHPWIAHGNQLNYVADQVRNAIRRDTKDKRFLSINIRIDGYNL